MNQEQKIKEILRQFRNTAIICDNDCHDITIDHFTHQIVEAMKPPEPQVEEGLLLSDNKIYEIKEVINHTRVQLLVWEKDEIADALLKAGYAKLPLEGIMPISNAVEIHEHPLFNGQYHQAVWVKAWYSSGTNNTPPAGTPIQCAICGVMKTS